MDGATPAGDIRVPPRSTHLHSADPATTAPVRSLIPAEWATGLTIAWCAAGTVLYLFAPKVAPVALVLSLVAPLLWLGTGVRDLRPFQLTHLTIALGVSALYLLVNASWSLAALDAYRSVLTYALAVAVPLVVIAAHRALNAASLRAMLLGIFLGYALGGALIWIGTIYEYAALRKLMNTFPVWHPDIDGAIIENGKYLSLPPHLLNHRFAALAFLLWPAVLAAIALADDTRKRATLLLALVPTVAVIFISHHATSKVAVLGGAAMFALSRYAPRIGMRALGATWIFACVAIVPLVFAIYATQAHTNEQLFWSARHRIVIWEYTAEKIAEAPILGAGVSSARGFDKLEEGTRTFEPGTKIPRETNLHAHNAYLQVWFETGAVGAALLLCIGLLLLGAIARAPAHVQPLLMATFTTHALVAAFGFSVWAPWVLASFALAAIFVSPSVALARRHPNA
jgi:O-antigen ligase